jgi:hypothetical protein
MRRLLAIAGAVLILSASLLVCGRWSGVRYAELLKPAITYNGLSYAALCCDKYHEQLGTWPTTLEQLRSFKRDLPEVTIDAWGRDFIFEPYDATNGYGQLISYGRDGLPGGRSEAENDLKVRFPLDTNGAWNDQARSQVRRPRTRFYGLFPYLPK